MLHIFPELVRKASSAFAPTMADNRREVAPAIQIERGHSHPLGATPDAYGVNFSVFADYATEVELLLFDEHDALEPTYTIQLDPARHKTFQFWHVYVRGIKPGMHYAYRVDGERDVHTQGRRFNRNKVLIDPYSRGNTDALWDRVAACGPHDNLATSMRSVIIDTSRYDWEGDRPLRRPMNETIIYEMHVRGFTQSPTSNCLYPGTFAGVIEKIPYLQELGITAVELLPVFDFDSKEVKGINPSDGQRLVNYWGYDPISFFAPENSYCVSTETGMHITEFRNMVKALHKAGIEVILDVVFNHTSEGDHRGPMINLKGFANGCYYMLSREDKQYYMNYSGCGNTVNGNHPITEKLIIDALTFWVEEMHVDGFRFDEAVILCRDENGTPMIYPPVIWQIELSDALIETKVIAEAWDAAGLYEVGFFPGFRWGEWNGRYRDCIRSFVRGDSGYLDGKSLVGRVADAIAGSADIFEAGGELPINSINFLTSHDGFTLNDLVSYNYKHNEANGEGNRDGNDNNLSWNCGIEGETEDLEVEALRMRQCKNFMAILMFSQGVPMFVAGDEVRRTQRGNNNAYCQDNPMSWFDWTLVEKNRELFRFCQQMIAFRKSHNTLQRRRFFSGQLNRRGLADISWHGCRLYNPGWYDPSSRVLAFTLGGFAEELLDDVDIHVMLNMEWENLDFDVPPLIGRKWYRVIDTSAPAPDDIMEAGFPLARDALITGNVCNVKWHSIVVLASFP
jgi:isoamylase